MNAPRTRAALDVSPRRKRRRAHTWRVLALWFAAMLPLAFWGLPSSRDDALLFGGESPWTAERYRAAEALAQRGERAAGADVDLNPLASSRQIVDLTADESQRATILSSRSVGTSMAGSE